MEESGRQAPFPILDGSMLEGPVRQALGRETARMVTWRPQSLTTYMGAATGGVYRLTGTARDGSTNLDWSLIVKIVSPAGWGAGEAEPTHGLYWQREALAYQSGLLDALPGGLTAPHCLGTSQGQGGAVWLWLEDVHDGYGPQWPLDQFARAARCLGRFNGAYLVDRPMPSYPWLTASGSLGGTLEGFAWVRELIDNPHTWDHPLLRSRFAPAVVIGLRRLWLDRAVLLDVFERLPQTLCHLDAWRRNMFAPRAEADKRLIVIDWASVGRGTVASDIGDLFGASYCTLCVEPCHPRDLATAVFDAYLQGLRDAGWQGDWRAVRFAFATFSALKYGCLLLWLKDIDDQEGQAGWERHSGHSMREFLDNSAQLLPYLLDLVDEARGLMTSL